MSMAEDNGINVIYCDDCQHLLGMYCCKWKHRYIFLNSRMDEHTAHMVIAHEIGHDKLHRELGKKGLQEFSLFEDIKSITEYEANAFAAHLLIDNDEIYQLLKEGYSIEHISKGLNVHPCLVEIKINEMKKLGYDLKLFTYIGGSEFLRKLNV